MTQFQLISSNDYLIALAIIGTIIAVCSARFFWTVLKHEKAFSAETKANSDSQAPSIHFLPFKRAKDEDNAVDATPMKEIA